MTSRRDTIMDALLEHLRAECGRTFLYYSRRFITWERLVQSVQAGKPVIRQPALFLFDGVGLGGGTDTFVSKTRASPPLVTLSKTIVIYAQLPGGGTPNGPDGLTPGGEVFNPLIEAIEAAMRPDSVSENALTLGGLVSQVELIGDSMMMTGEIDDQQGQGMLTMPVKIMMYPSSQ